MGVRKNSPLGKTLRALMLLSLKTTNTIEHISIPASKDEKGWKTWTREKSTRLREPLQHRRVGKDGKRVENRRSKSYLEGKEEIAFQGASSRKAYLA